MLQLAVLAPLALALFFGGAHAQQTCGVGRPCGTAAPCCSEFGFCGTGTQCLGGCNPLTSKTLTSCRPAPICEDEKISFVNLDRILANSTLYEGNATTHDFIVDKGNVFVSSGNELILTLNQKNNGTRISSTRYVHYATITATMKVARSAGIVNAFITMSDVHDEIDFEWPGPSTTGVQSNFFWLGHVDYSASNGGKHDGLSDTFANFHDYTIDWKPDSLSWIIDGKVVRTVQKTDTLSKDGSYYAYPTTPSRVQFSIWPAGIPGTPQGTVDWAGGMINWNDPDYVAQGHFAVVIKSVTVKCYSETAKTTANNGTLPAGAQSYVYTTNDTTGVVPRVFVSNESTNVNGGMPAIPGGLAVGLRATSAVAAVLSVFAFFV